MERSTDFANFLCDDRETRVCTLYVESKKKFLRQTHFAAASLAESELCGFVRKSWRVLS